MKTAPLVIEFVSGSRICREEPAQAAADLSEQEQRLVWRHEEDGGTFVELKDGSRVALPSDQIVLDEQVEDFARVGLGGMSFEGVENDQLVFWRVRDVLPDEFLSPGRELKVTIQPGAVKRIEIQGQQAWPRA